VTLGLKFSTMIEMSLMLSSEESSLDEFEEDDSERGLRGIDNSSDYYKCNRFNKKDTGYEI
jgi:hypothetical protein